MGYDRKTYTMIHFEPCCEVSLYSLLRVISEDEVGYFGILGFVIYLSGSFVNVYSEFQRYFWKLENDGLYTSGLFSFARHINYFGEVSSFVGFAMLSGYLDRKCFDRFVLKDSQYFDNWCSSVFTEQK